MIDISNNGLTCIQINDNNPLTFLNELILDNNNPNQYISTTNIDVLVTLLQT